MKIETTDGAIDSYVAVPDGSNTVPAVVVVHEIFGLNDDIRRWCDRFAGEGYLAVAPDLYDRGWTLSCLVSTFRQLRAGEGQAFRDIEATRRAAVEHPRCNGKAGIIGFCMGGGFALLMAPTGLFDVASVNYGEVPDGAGSLLDGACPVVASYGEDDQTLGDDAERLEKALREHDVRHDIETYEGVGHGFLNDKESRILDFVGSVVGIGYDEEAAEDAWGRIRRMFDEYLRTDRDDG